LGAKAGVVAELFNGYKLAVLLSEGFPDLFNEIATVTFTFTGYYWISLG
jgi:hypothetical protein